MSTSFKPIFACVLLTFLAVTDSSRILGFFITPSKSHVIIYTEIVNALAEQGHDVTIVTTIPLITKHPRIRHIQLEHKGLHPDYYKRLIAPPPWYKNIFNIINYLTVYNNISLNQPPMRKLMEEESFDMVIQGYLFNEFFLGLGAHFKCPIILAFVVRPIGSLNGFVGNPQEVSYIPSLLTQERQPLGFMARLRNFIYLNFFEEIVFNYFYHWYQEGVYNDSARILGLFPTHGKGHLIVHTAVADALAERGHDVTVVTTIPLIRTNPRYRHIQLNVTGFSSNFYAKRIHDAPPWYEHIPNIIQRITKYANSSLNDPQMKKLMEDESFDLVIHGYLANEFLLGVAAHFKCPVVISLMVRPIASVNDFVGNPTEIAYVPSLTSGLKQPMGFLGRLKNFFYVNLVEKLVIKYYYQWYQTMVYKENFPPEKYPSFDEVRKNVSLVLTNHHFSQTPIRPNVPAMVEIGGIQIKDKPDPLPEDIKSILDNSTKHGAVYFSLGSNVQGSFLDSSKVKIIFDVLSKLPETVLWKWGDSDFPGQSPNIVYKSWLPQDDILNHKNVKLFITHGGQGSVVESQYHGVPMVGIPLFGEQSSNMENVVKEGYGLSVDYLTLTEKDFSSAVQEVLSNKKYTDKVRKFAKLYKDRPMTAKETAVFWVEYVLRHHGAPHMQSPAVHLNMFQLLSLDVIGFLLAVIYISYKVIKVIFCLLIGLCRKKKSKTE